MPFTEDARVKIPAILHLTRLGFDYLSLLINNLASIKHSPEFATNKSPLAPTNRLSTSLFSRDRLAFLLRFAFAYVRTAGRLEKHVMRYPRLFATLAIIRVLAAGIRKEAENHLALLNQREALENAHDNTNLLNIALEDVLFTFLGPTV